MKKFPTYSSMEKNNRRKTRKNRAIIKKLETERDQYEAEVQQSFFCYATKGERHLG